MKENELQKEIRKRIMDGESQKLLAKEFRVSHPTINAIHKRRIWKWLNP